MTNAERVGAMVFAASLPLAPQQDDDAPCELAALAEVASRLEYRMDVPEQLRLFLRGGSPGGARPPRPGITNAYMPTYCGPLPPSGGVHSRLCSGSFSSQALQCRQFCALMRTLPPSSSYTAAGQ